VKTTKTKKKVFLKEFLEDEKKSCVEKLLRKKQLLDEITG
jgi:hypothetical protein